MPVVRRAVLLSAALYGLTAFDEYFGLLALEHGADPTSIPLLVGLTVAGQAIGTATAGRTASWPGRVLGALVAVAAVLMAVGSLLGQPWLAFAALGAGYGLISNVSIVADARLQDAIEGPARATVTSTVSLGAEVVALGVFGVFAVGPAVASIARDDGGALGAGARDRRGGAALAAGTTRRPLPCANDKRVPQEGCWALDESSPRSSAEGWSRNCRTSSTGPTSSSRWPTCGHASRARSTSISPACTSSTRLDLDELTAAADAAARLPQHHRHRRRPGGRRREVLRLEQGSAAVAGADRDDRQRAVRPPGRAAQRRSSCATSATPCRRRSTSTWTSSRALRRPSTAAASPTSSATTPPTSTGSSRTMLGKAEERWPYDPAWSPQARERLDSVLDAPRRHPRGQRGGHPHPDDCPPLGRRDLPRRGLEPPAHRGRRPLLLLQPRAPDRSALHPRPAGRPRDRLRLGAAGQRAGQDAGGVGPAAASTSVPRRWASRGTT